MTSLALRPEGAIESARLFEAYSERLLGYCQRRLGSRAEAEDAVQTTFLYAHRALERGVVPESEAAWLFTIAKNVCRWQQRSASRRAPVTDLDPDTVARPHDGDPDGLLRQLDDALASIPERQRQAILLREWRGLSGREIASTLELSESATHALLTRARRSLASALTSATKRPVLGLDVGSLFLQLRSLLVGSGAKVAATALAIASVGATGYTVERALVGQDRDPSRQTPRVMPVARPSVTAGLGAGAGLPVSAKRPEVATHVSSGSLRSIAPVEGTSQVPAASSPAGEVDASATPADESTTLVTPEESPPAETSGLPADDVQPPDLPPALEVGLPTVSTPLPAEPEVPTVDLPDAPPLPAATDPVTSLLP